MEGLSFWSMQALQNLGSDGPFEVKYFRSSEEVFRSHYLAVSSDSDPAELNFCGGRQSYKAFPDPFSGRTAEGHKAKQQTGKKKPKGDGGGGGGGGGGGNMGKKKEGKIEKEAAMMVVVNIEKKEEKDEQEEEKKEKKEDYKKKSDDHFIFNDRNDTIGMIRSIDKFLKETVPEWQRLLDRVQKAFHSPFSKPNGGHAHGGDKWGNALPTPHYKYALVYGETTIFNPSGIWVVEEFYNNDDA